MKYIIDTKKNKLTIAQGLKRKKLDLYSKDSFENISDLWVKIGWNERYYSTFSWLGLPVLQLPEDILRVQELIYNLKPDVIVECGVCQGGSVLLYASILKILGKGRVIGVDINISDETKVAVQNCLCSEYITLIEGNSVAPEIVNQVKSSIKPDEKVLVILDSCHTKDHVYKELESYSDLVNVGSYIIATDGIIEEFCDTPLGEAEWKTDNAQTAVKDFLKTHNEFVLEQPQWLFNRSLLSKNITYWPNSWLKKVK